MCGIAIQSMYNTHRMQRDLLYESPQGVHLILMTLIGACRGVESMRQSVYGIQECLDPKTSLSHCRNSARKGSELTQDRAG